jgi:hypothetical protein
VATNLLNVSHTILTLVVSQILTELYLQVLVGKGMLGGGATFGAREVRGEMHKEFFDNSKIDL